MQKNKLRELTKFSEIKIIIGGIKMILSEMYKMNNDLEIPNLALGTWLIDDNKAAGAVRQAIKIGYRHIDTAQAYENEE